MTGWLIVLGAGAGSFLFRISVVALIDRISAPAALERVAMFVVPAAFAGLAAAALTRPLAAGGAVGLALALSVAVTATAAARGRSVPVAFTAGVLTMWLTTGISTRLP